MTKISPPPKNAATVNSEAVTVVATPDINAATPDNTPVPGGGSWAWNYSLAAWVDLGAPAPATPATNLIQPE
jgi:hypothetical protein